MRDRLLDVVTVSALLGTLAMAIYLVAARPAPPPAAPTNRVLDDWRQYGDVGHRMGPDSASVSIVVFSDYECPACRLFEGYLQETLHDHPGDVSIVYRHYPLPQHTKAKAAAIAAECASYQDAFKPFHHALMSDSGWFADGDLYRIANVAGVPDTAEFRRCLAAPRAEERVDEDIRAATELGVRGTPTLLINEVMYGEPPSPYQLGNLVDVRLQPEVDAETKGGT